MLSTITSTGIIKKFSNSKPNPHGGRRRTRIDRIHFVRGWSFVSPPRFLFNGVSVIIFSCFLAASQIVAVPTNSSNTSSTLISGTISPSSSSLLNSANSSTTHKKHPVDHLKLGIAIGASSLSSLLLLSMAAAALFACCFGFIKLRRRRSRGRGELNLERVAAITTSAPPEEKQEEEKKPIVGRGGPRRFTWDEMERFSSNFSSVIGSGGFSTVYLSQFPDSSLGAIKIHSASSERLNRVYKQELEILVGLRHGNIVKLIGYCDDREEGVLVFEYVPNGNLQEKLHPKTTAEVLSWNSRVKIAFQLAQALEYLHHKCPLQIVHGDIKPSNILLDQRLNCKLCDFGSAKMGFSSTVLPPSSSSSTAAAINRMMLGSPGYTDPHYLRTGIASKKNDVYSFGVILLELITGREALCSLTGQRLTSTAAPMLKDASKVAQMMDARLFQSQHHHHHHPDPDPDRDRDRDHLQFSATTHSHLLEQVQAVASISAMCLSDSPTLRPSASDILAAFAARIPSSLSFSFASSTATDNKL